MSDRPLLARGRKLNGYLAWHLPGTHVVTVIPEADASGPPGISTSSLTPGVARGVLWLHTDAKSVAPSVYG